jgi:pimeloyl-ACP methyl ester carboxylesterase
MQHKEATSNTSSEAVNSKTKFIEVNEQRFAYRSIGTGLPIILLNRFRGTLDTWDPAFLGGLAATSNVITIDYSGIGLSTGKCTSDVLSMAKNVKAVAEALNLSKFIVAGWSLGGMVAQTVITKYPALVSQAILIGATPPGKNTGVPEEEFWDRALKPVNDLDDGIILFFEPKSESSKNAAKLSFGRMAQRTDDLDTPVSKECWTNQRKAIEDFREDKYNALDELKKSTIPTLVIMGDHDIGFHVEDWYPLIGDLESTQLIVLPRAGHAPQHQYPDLVANYITSFIHGWK